MNFDEDVNEHINSVGTAILSDEFFRTNEWDAISLVCSVAPGVRSYEGFIYHGASYKPASPDHGRPISKKVLALQEAMTPQTAEPWKQALIQITKPGPEINIKFEYDDPNRWSLKTISLDNSGYAESLRPKGKKA